MCLTAFTGSNTANQLRAILNHLRCVVGAFIAGKTLNYNFGIFIYEDAHTIIMCAQS
jgi:hypothetical protein